MLPLKKTNRAFTAVEIAMVASVIAILALLILPIFRQRAEDARQAAVQDEMSSLVKMQLLIEADMPGGNYLVQLNSMDNASYQENPGAADGSAPELEPPRYKWDRVNGEFARLSNVQYFNTTVPNWDGPYVAFPRGYERDKTVSMLQIRDEFPLLTTQNSGPITVPDQAPWNEAALSRDRYPVDPWGTPYLLFGPTETIYNSRVLYSLGPNGVPGSVVNPPPQAYSRTFGLLGTGDDLEFIF